MTQAESSTPEGRSPELPPEVEAMLRPMNAWAVASLVLGLLGGSLLGIAAGVAALRQLRTRNQLGRGQAIAGIALSAVWLAVQLTVGVLAVVSPETLDDTPHPAGTAVRSLKAGTCLDVIPGLTNQTLTGRQYGERGNPVPCDRPHHVEIAYSTTFPDGPFPGDTAARQTALALCGKGFADYADDWGLPGLTARIVLAPTARSWPKQDRTVMCVYEDVSQPDTGSVHLDPTRLTAAQRAYLQAARPYNLAVPREHLSLPDRTYSAALAQAERQSADALQAAGLPGQAHDLAAALRARADGWQAAAEASEGDLVAKYTAAKDADDAQLRPLAATLRTALGLPATHPGSDPGI